MTEFASSNPWVLAFIGLLLGLLLGVLGAQLFERRKTGGRTVDDVQREMDDYKEEVGNHFATTSELFRDMTEKYRDVYNHLAAGSQTLCEDSMEHARLEFAQSKSVESTEELPEEENALGQEADPNGDSKDMGQVEEPATDSGSEKEPKRDDPPLGV